MQNTNAILTGLSDFHKLVVTILKINSLKNKHLEINYKNYKHFDQSYFKEHLKTAFSNNDIQTYKDFEIIVIKILDHRGTLKRKILRVEQLRNEIMKKYQFEEFFLKNLLNKSLKACKKQNILLVDCIKMKEKCFLLV